jgi:Kef-type K+ transport system membrane component KefB
VAQSTGASVLIAGFGAGLMLAATGGPKRLSTEVLGVAGGLFVPLFFVLLGASLQLRGVVTHPSILALTVLLVVLAVAVHVIAGAGAAALSRRQAALSRQAERRSRLPAAS